MFNAPRIPSSSFSTSSKSVRSLQSVGKTLHYTIYVVIAIIFGSFTYNIYPVPVNIIGLLVLVGLFFNCLQRRDDDFFFILLFIGNFFIFGNKFGGNYNLSAFIAISLYYILYQRSYFTLQSVFPRPVVVAIGLLGIVNFLSVLGGNDFSIATQFQSIFSFTLVLLLYFITSKSNFSTKFIFKFVGITGFVYLYLFCVAVNQKFEIFNINYPFFPATDTTIEYELGIIRPGSTLNNFEAYAEFSLSLIALLLPGILTGSFFKANWLFGFFSIILIFVAIFSIVLTGTRSSFVLLPLLIVLTILFLVKRLKIWVIGILLLSGPAIFFLNESYKFVDISSFIERNGQIDLKRLSIERILRGEDMNRGEIFSYALKQVKSTNPFIGRGYFSTIKEYRSVHFEPGVVYDSVADYHNLYMSAYVLWGGIGFGCLMLIMIWPVTRGYFILFKPRSANTIESDVLVGFTLLFSIFFINQFKIQFIRDVNYLSIILLMFLIYYALTERRLEISERF